MDEPSSQHEPDHPIHREAPRAAAIKTAKGRARAKATLHRGVRHHAEPVLVVGATGAFGAGVARELISRGEPVRLLVRNQRRAVDLFGTSTPAEIVRGDALQPDEIVRAADGARALVAGAAPAPDRLDPELIELGRSMLDAAGRASLPLLVPGHVLVFGNKADAPIDERCEPAPTTGAGRVRAELEAMLRQAADDGRARVCLLRSGDFFGPTVRNRLVDGLFGCASAGRPMRYPGRLDVAHQWAYVPDLARVAVWLLDRAAHLRPFEVLHFKGHVAERMDGFCRRIAEIAGHPGLPVRRVSGARLRLAALRDAQARALFERRYLFQSPVVLDDRMLMRNWEDFRVTDLDKAIGETIGSYRA